jgi:hypothetical protein
MSDTYTDSLEELEPQDIVPVPLVQMLMLDGGYFGATISLAGDPDAPNLAEQVKTRLLLAHDGGALDSRITSCLISDYGLLQEDAETVPRLTMVEGAPVVAEEPSADERALAEAEISPDPLEVPTAWQEPQAEGEHEPQREA